MWYHIQYMSMDRVFTELRNTVEKQYKEIGAVYSPYFQEDINFNAKGLEHLKFKKRSHARSRKDQAIRFRLFHLAPEVLKISRTIQGIVHTKNMEMRKTGSRWEQKLCHVSYYEFIAVVHDVRVRVIVKQIESGPKFFWSVIPHWRVRTKTGEKRMHYGTPEVD